MRFHGVSLNRSIDAKIADTTLQSNDYCSIRTIANDCGDRCSSFVAVASLE